MSGIMRRRKAGDRRADGGVQRRHHLPAGRQHRRAASRRCGGDARRVMGIARRQRRRHLGLRRRPLVCLDRRRRACRQRTARLNQGADRHRRFRCAARPCRQDHLRQRRRGDARAPRRTLQGGAWRRCDDRAEPGLLSRTSPPRRQQGRRGWSRSPRPSISRSTRSRYSATNILCPNVGTRRPFCRDGKRA